MGTQQENLTEVGNNDSGEMNILPSSKFDRLMIGVITIFLPAVSFALVFQGGVAPEWQSSSSSDYVEIMLGGQVTVYFYPFLIYSMVCMFNLLVSPERYGEYFAIRVGIYTGMILATQYSLILVLSSYSVYVWYSLAFWILLSISWLHPRTRIWLRERGLYWYAIIGVIMLAGIIINYLGGGFFNWFYFLLLGMSVFAVGPFACLLIAYKLSIKLLKKFKLSKTSNRAKFTATVGWGVPYLVAWRFAIVRTLEIYAELPITPPSDCYIASAAAKGNPSTVKSTPIQIQGEDVLEVNDQLRYLKCAELGLKTIFPGVHRHCRRVYDNYGKKIARKITTPTQANLAYLSLKPFEWASRLLLRMLVPNIGDVANRLYVNHKPN